MNTVVLDIETVGLPVDSFDEGQLAYLQRNEQTPGEALDKLALWPLTGRVVMVGMLNPQTQEGLLLPLSENETSHGHMGRLARFKVWPHAKEADLLGMFWANIARYQRVVTFNGRCFDVPFLKLRSAMLGVKIGRTDLMKHRYSTTPHCDLLDQLTEYGATRKFSLDWYCRSFGIPSPKAGCNGSRVGQLFSENRIDEIVEYGAGDLEATAALYDVWMSRLGGA